ncbi:MAG: hypothetical protein WC197_04650, partial [Candidatus Gastranaerophilaceae bacterium]
MKKRLSKFRKLTFVSILIGIFTLNSAVFADTTEKNIVPVMDIKGRIIKEEIKTETPLKAWINGDSATGDWNG